jgi:type I restriction enzyme M protein
MNEIKQKEMPKSLQWRISKLIDELRSKIALHDSHLFLLVVCAAVRKAGSSQFTRGSRSAFEFLNSLADNLPDVLSKELQVSRFVSDDAIGRTLELAQELAEDRSYLMSLWNEAREYNRSDKLSRFISENASRLCVAMGDIQQGEEVSCVFTPAFDVVESINHADASVSVDETDNNLIATLYGALFGLKIETSSLHAEEILEKQGAEIHDVVFSIPPFGFKVRPEKADELAAKYIYRGKFFENLAILHAKRSARRRAVVMLPAASLSRTTSHEREFKRELVGKRAIEAIIKLPIGAFTSSRLPAIILVLAGDHCEPRDGIFMADVAEMSKLYGHDKAMQVLVEAFKNGIDGDLFRTVDLSEIEKNLFNMDPSRYLSTELNKQVEDFFAKRSSAELGSLVEVIRPPVLSEDPNGSEEVREIAISDITEIGDIRAPAKRFTINREQIYKAGKVKLMPGDILLSVKGTVGHVALVPPHDGVWFPGQVFVVLRLVGEGVRLSERYLFHFLKSEVGQKLMKSKQKHGGMQTLSAQDLWELPIPLASFEEVRKVDEEHLKIHDIQVKIDRMRTEIEERQRKFWE